MKTTLVTRFVCLFGACAAALAFLFSAASGQAVTAAQLETVSNKLGDLHVPSDYRTAYEFLGAWAIADTAGQPTKQMHIVYATPGTSAAFHKTGHFPDNTVLIKEVLATATESMTTGSVAHADKLVGWFVMVKDTKNRHPGNKLWGDGWGWSFFDAANRERTTSTDYKKDCQSCHVPAQNTDWIYVQGYGPLQK